MRFVQLTDTCWANPEMVARVEQHGSSTIVYFTSGRERAIPNTRAERVLNLLTEGGER